MAEQVTETEQQAQFIIQKIYTKDVSFEAPLAPEVFREEWQPNLDIQLDNQFRQIDDENNYEVLLTVTATAKLGDKTAFLVEVKQAGIFTLVGYSDEEMEPLLGSYCPNTVFPFAREVIADLVTKGGFPQLVLAPINFDAMYMQQKQQAAAEAQEAPKH